MDVIGSGGGMKGRRRNGRSVESGCWAYDVLRNADLLLRGKDFEGDELLSIECQRGQRIRWILKAPILHDKLYGFFAPLLHHFDQLDPRGRECDVAVDFAGISESPRLLQHLPPCQ